MIKREEGRPGHRAHHKEVSKRGGGPDRGLRPLVCLFAAVWFAGQSTSSLSGVRGQRSVAVVELPAFLGTIRAFPCLHVYMAALTNVKY